MNFIFVVGNFSKNLINIDLDVRIEMMLAKIISINLISQFNSIEFKLSIPCFDSMIFRFAMIRSLFTSRLVKWAPMLTK